MIFQLFDVIFPKDETVVERDIKPTKSMYVMEEINKYIANYIRDGITVEDVAVSMSLSSRQLNRICHKHAGKSLNKLINDEKLKFIKELIATTTLSFADIAHVAGFSSEYALNRFFKYAEGYTLGQYKKLAKL